MSVSKKVSFVKSALLSSSALVASIVAAPVQAEAAVVDGTFVEGSGSFSTNGAGDRTTITVNDRNTIAEFGEYNIDAGETVHYNHTLGRRATANHLSRVTGGTESRILGSITSSGVNVFLVNPNGIFFGAGSSVNVPNLVASSTDISNSNFAGENYNFNQAGKANAKVVNDGTITVERGGMAALVAPGAENNGAIVARSGTVVVASAEEFTVDMFGDNLVNFAVTKEAQDGYVKQTGDIFANDGGLVVLTTQDANSIVNNVINMDGVVEADTVRIEGGEIILGSSADITSSDVDLDSASDITTDKDSEIHTRFVDINAKEDITLNGKIAGRAVVDIDLRADGDVIVNTDIETNGDEFTVSGLSGDYARSFTSLGEIDVTANGSSPERPYSFGRFGSYYFVSNSDGDVDVNAFNININEAVTAGTTGDVSLASNAGTINVLDDITARDINIDGANLVNMNAALNYSNALTGANSVVNVITNRASIQDAIDITKDTGDVNIMAGTYNENFVVEGKAVDITGGFNGRFVLSGEAFDIADTGTVITSGTGAIGKFTDASNSTITNVTFTGDGATNGLLVTGSDNVKVTNVKGNGKTTDAIRVHNSDGVVMDGVEAENASRHGVLVTSSRDVQFLNGRSDGNTWGFVAKNNGTANITVDNSTFTNNKGCGIEFAQGNAGEITGTVTNSTITGNGITKYGVVNYGSNVVVENTTVEGSTIAGIRTWAAGNSTNAIKNQALQTTLTDVTLTDNVTGVLVQSGNVTFDNVDISGGTTGIRALNYEVTDNSSAIEFIGTENSISGTPTYISLENGAMDNLDVDVSQVAFDGVKGGEMTDAQLVAFEDKVHHEMDDTGVGALYARANTLVATTNNLGIQAAVDASAGGDNVVIGGGSYDESVLIAKNVDLNGAEGTGEVIVAPTSQAALDNEWRSSYNWNEVNKGVILVQDATSNISNITVDGSGVSTGYLNTSTQFERLVGIGYDNASGTVDGVTVQNIADDAQNRSVGIFADSNSTYNDKTVGVAGLPGTILASADVQNQVTITDSSVTEFQHTGINANGDLLNADTTGNTVVSENAQVGINYSLGTTGTIMNNIVDVRATDSFFFGGNSSDILLDRTGAGVEVVGNTITAADESGIGIEVHETQGFYVEDNTVSGQNTGILITDSSEGEVNLNTVEGNNDGITLLRADDNNFAENAITGNENAGVNLYLSNRNTFAEDTVSENGTGYNISTGSFDNVITDATITDNGAGVYIGLADGLASEDGSPERSPTPNRNAIVNTTISGGDTAILVDGIQADLTAAPINLTLDGVTIEGEQTEAAIQFQNATTVDGVVVNDVQLLSEAPVGWRFVEVTGGAPTDEFGTGDIDFTNTVFGDTYEIADIELVDSLLDGDASNATFINDGGSAANREARVFHTIDDAPEGTIFYAGFGQLNFGNLFGNLADLTDIEQVYYNPLSTAGVAFDTPSIEGVSAPQTFNTANNFQVSLTGNGSGPAATQLANATPSDLNNLATAAGGEGSELNELETAAGGNTISPTCEVSFATNFLNDDVNLANANGSCGANPGITQ